MLVHEVSMTTILTIGIEIMEKNNSAAIQYICSKKIFTIKITTAWNALPYDVLNSRIISTSQNRLDSHWKENHPDVQVNWKH